MLQYKSQFQKRVTFRFDKSSKNVKKIMGPKMKKPF